MLLERLAMKNKVNYLGELVKKHRIEVGISRNTGAYLEESALEIAEEMRKMWNRLDVFYDALIDVRNKALEGFESEGSDTYKTIADLAQEALDKVTENGRLREVIKE